MITDWDELHAYRLVAYPDDLTVVTNASAAAFDEAVEAFGNPPERRDRNIETILQDMGFAAITACTATDGGTTIQTWEL